MMAFMKPLRQLLLVLVVMFIVLFSWAGSTHALMLEVSFEELVEGADSIVTGNVESIHSYLNDDDGVIYTQVTISVDEALKGPPANKSITIITEGGRVGDRWQWVQHEPVFQVDEKVGLFLKETPAPGGYGRGPGGTPPFVIDKIPYRVHGLFQGKIELAQTNSELTIKADPTTNEAPANRDPAGKMTATFFAENVDRTLKGQPLLQSATEPDLLQSATEPEIIAQSTDGPVINSIGPSSGPAGTGLEVTIWGSGFGKREHYLQDAVLFYYKTDAGENLYMHAPVLFWADTAIRVQVPIETGWYTYPYSASSGPVIVRKGGTDYGFHPFSVTFGACSRRWQVGTSLSFVDYWINDGGVPGRLEAVKDAADTWNTAYANIFLRLEGTTTASSFNLLTNDGMNKVFWTELPDNVVGRARLYGTCHLLYDMYKTEGADFAFNSLLDWNTSETCPASSFDVHSVALHEFGHWLSLRDLYGNLAGYPQDIHKVMYGRIAPGTINRELHENDMEGVRHIYGVSAAMPYPPPEPQLLYPVRDDALETYVDETYIVFHWEQIPGAERYHLQIAPHAPGGGTFEPENLFVDDPHIYSNASWKEGFPKDGSQYSWRVRALNLQGLWGEWSSMGWFHNGPELHLTFPENNAYVSEEEITFRWHRHRDATYYTFQLSECSNFSSFLVNEPNVYELFNPHFNHGGLPGNGTRYYWRVGARNAEAFLGWTEVYTFVSGSPPPDPPGLGSPWNWIHQEGTEVTFTWNESEGAEKYHLQVSACSEFSSPLFGDFHDFPETNFTVYDLPDDGTRFYWRVRAYSTLGGWGEWSNVRIFRNGELLPPTLKSPSGGQNMASGEVTFTWDPVEVASSYELWVCTSDQFMFVPFKRETDITETSVTLSGFENDGQTFWWRVKAVDESFSTYPPLTSDWSDPANFINGTVPAPTTILPADGTTEFGEAIAFYWSPSPRATKYHLQVSTESSFKTPQHDIDDLAHFQKLLWGFPNDGTIYYWRVRSYSDGGWGEWSHTVQFINGEFLAPELVSPENGANVAASRVTFQWSASGSATRYHLQVSTCGKFSSTVIDDSRINSTSSQKSRFPNDGTAFYWRVRAYCAVHGWSNWSERGYFINGTAVPPTLVSPANDAYMGSDPVTFEWGGPVDGANRYHLQVSTDSDFENPHFENDDLKSLSLTHNIQPKDGTRYYWRVRAYSEPGGWGNWSVVRGFFNGPIPPPTLMTPGDDVNIASAAISFGWAGVRGTDRYRLEVSDRIDFSTTFINDDQITDLGIVKSDFPNNGKRYYWRVSAYHESCGWGEPSDERTFVNGTVPPPVLELPGDDANAPSTEIEFHWKPVLYATKYHLQVSASDAFAVLLVNDPYITSTPVTKSGFPDDGTVFYWRVAAHSLSGGWGSWSEAQSFTNGTPSPPEMPQLLTPEDGAYVPDAHIEFSWEKSFGASKYHLQVKNEQGELFYEKGDLTSTEVSVGEFPKDGTRYNWRVSAYNDLGGWSPWSAPGSFTNGIYYPPPEPPNLLSPEKGESVALEAILFQWEESSSASEYHLQISYRDNFAPESIFFENNQVKSTGEHVAECTVNDFPNDGTHYYWRVRAHNDSGGWSDWSPAWPFTNGILQQPVLHLPAEGAIIETGNVTFTWSPTSGASAYHLQVSTSGQFTTIDTGGYTTFIDVPNLTTNSYTGVGFPVDDTVFYWRVRVCKQDIWSGWSSGWSEIRRFISGADVERGSLSVTIGPKDAASAGGQWRLTEGPAPGWKDSGATISELPAGSYTVTFKEMEGWEKPADITVTISKDQLSSHAGTYTRLSYSVTVAAEPSEGGKVSGGGTYTHGETITVSATAAMDYHFTDWTEGGRVVSKDANYKFIVTADRELVANFALRAYTISASANPKDGGTITGTGTYAAGSSVTLTATPAAGYEFVNWTEDGKRVSSRATYSFNARTDRTLVANFTPKTYTIAVSAEPSEGGKVSGGGTYTHGETITVSAIAGMGYRFVNWAEGGRAVSTDAGYKFTVTADRNLVANFEPMTGSLLVFIEPKEAINAGAKWRLTSEPETAWKDSGTIYALPVGSYTVTFKEMEGWTRPADIMVRISEGGLIWHTGTYTIPWPDSIKVRATNITADSVTLLLSEAVPGASGYVVYYGEGESKTFSRPDRTDLFIGGLARNTWYTFTVQALFGDEETFDGPSVRVRTKR